MHDTIVVVVFFQYLFAFSEYLYLQLVALISPEAVVYRRHCERRINETLTRNELHYASATVVFLIMGVFQLIVSGSAT